MGTDILIYTDNETLKVDKGDDLQVEKVTVHGSNTTFNCLSDKIAWNVNESKIIPLSGVGSHDLTIYSKGEVKPSVSIGGHNFNLGWDGKGITTRQNSKMLTPHTDHNITLECIDSTPNETNCTLLVGNERRGPFPCKNGLCYLTMTGSATRPFVITLKNTVQEQNDENTGVGLNSSMLLIIASIVFLLSSSL